MRYLIDDVEEPRKPTDNQRLLMGMTWIKGVEERCPQCGGPVRASGVCLGTNPGSNQYSSNCGNVMGHID